MNNIKFTNIVIIVAMALFMLLMAFMKRQSYNQGMIDQREILKEGYQQAINNCKQI